MPLDNIPALETELSAPAPMVADRRQVLRNAGLGAALLGTIGAGATALTPRRADAAGITDADVLNFALNLEYLEAEFYLRATTGQGLGADEVTGSGTLGGVTGGSKVPFTSMELMEIANEITVDEHKHVLFLRKALGSAKIARPKIDLLASFTNLARAAGVCGPTQFFNPFYDEYTFLLGAYIFEDVGVTAYHGAAGFIQTPAYLSAAAGILGVEAYHAGILRLSILRKGTSLTDAAAKVSALRAKLSGEADDSGPGVMPGVTPVQTNLVPTDADSIAFARTPRQVLNVVYGAVNATKGLFFPAGMNGTITA